MSPETALVFSAAIILVGNLIGRAVIRQIKANATKGVVLHVIQEGGGKWMPFETIRYQLRISKPVLNDTLAVLEHEGKIESRHCRGVEHNSLYDYRDRECRPAGITEHDAND